jgi:NADH-quinone oxidoreductase subunit D
MDNNLDVTLTPVSLDEIKHLISDRAIQGETVLLNMGPQHPSTHGVLRLLLELDGEEVINCIPDIGFCLDRNMEAKTYIKAEVMTDRLDYLNNLGNNLTYCMAIERLVELEVPPRAQAIRVLLTELQRISSHLIWLGTHALDAAAMSVFLYCFREREAILDIFEMVSGQRMMTTYFRPGGLWRDTPVEFEQACANYPILSGRHEYHRPDRNPIFMRRTKEIRILAGSRTAVWRTGPMRAAKTRSQSPTYSGYRLYDFDVPIMAAYLRGNCENGRVRQALRI